MPLSVEENVRRRRRKHVVLGTPSLFPRVGERLWVKLVPFSVDERRRRRPFAG